VPDLSQEPRHYGLPEASEMRSELAVPLKTKERVIGVLHVQSAHLNAFDESDLAVLQSLAHQAAIAIENARLYDQAQREIAERVRAEAELRRYQEHLEERVEERTAELRESEERYRTLFDGVPVGLFRSTPGGQMVDANLALVEMLGYPSREGLLAINTAGLYVDPEERVRWKALMEREGVVRDFEVRNRRHDGTVIWVKDTARAVKDEQGQVLYYEGSLEDITKHKQAETELRRYQEHLEELVEARTVELRESEERYRTLFDGMPVGLYRSTPAGHFLDVNQAFVQMAGCSDRETLLAANTATLYVDPEEQVRWKALMEREGVVRDFEARIHRHDGTVIWGSDTARAVKDAQGQVLYYEGSMEDITERKRLEEEIRREKEYAEAANQAKSTFLANMSHELRTPLNAILGFTQLMGRDPNLTTVQQENLGIINRSGEHLLTLINDVLEMSKIEAGRVMLQEGSFDLHRLLDGLEEMFGLRARDKGLVLSCERAEDVPRYVRTDEGKLRQILSNLLGNAVKFTQVGGVALRVTASISRQDKQALHFEVEDTGPGIAPEELEVVFDPFVQATSGRQLQEGTGLGLSISRQYARLMGGDITVRSKPGEGSLFEFDVQVGLAGEAETWVAGPSRRVVGLQPGQRAADGGPYRILVAEDRETNRRLLVQLLRGLAPPPLGFEVREAINGREALEIWERWEPHLIWMDMRMPVMDGYEATRRIKATPQGQATIIVALTASAFDEDRERVLAEGCDDFVRKPFREDEIFDTLTRHLGLRFVYEEPALPATARPADAALQTDALTPAAQAALPAGWVAELRQATIKADLNLILALIGHVQEQNPALADALAGLARDFEYKKILAWIEQSGGSG